MIARYPIIRWTGNPVDDHAVPGHGPRRPADSADSGAVHGGDPGAAGGRGGRGRTRIFQSLSYACTHKNLTESKLSLLLIMIKVWQY